MAPAPKALRRNRPGTEPADRTGDAARLAPDGPGAQDLSAALKHEALRHLSRREFSRHELHARLLGRLPRLWQRLAGEDAANHPSDAMADGDEDHGDGCESRGGRGQGDRRGHGHGHGRPNGDRQPDEASPLSLGASLLPPLLDALEAAGLLSNARFVDSRVHHRAPARGIRRIDAELRQHGLSLGAAERQQLLSTELERAIALCRRRYRAAPADLRERARRQRYLLGCGFDADVARAAIDTQAAEDAQA